MQKICKAEVQCDCCAVVKRGQITNDFCGMENDALVEKQLGSEQHINLILKRIR